MANVKNFGLIGVGADLQFGKAGTRLVNNEGVFNFKAANGSTDVALTSAGITSSAGNVTLTTGNVVLTSASGVVSIGGDNMLQAATGGYPQLSGVASVLIPTGATASRPGTGVAGMVRVNNDTPTASYVEFFNGTAWATLATGGSTGALQTEIDNIETTLGTMINTDGTSNTAAALTSSLFGGASTLTAALNNLASGISSKDTLDEIEPGEGAGKVLYLDGGNTWQQALPGSTSGVQAWDAGLDALSAKTSTGIIVQTGADTYGTATITGPASGISVTNGDGVAGNPTLALTNDLAALENLSGTGFAVRSAADTWVQRSLVAPAAGFTITDPAGIAGNPTFALANDLAAVEGLTTVGYMVRTGDGTAATRTMNVVSGDLAITGDADGQSTDTTFGLATVTQAATGSFVKVTLDTKGRVTGNTAVTTSDITTLVDGTYVNVTGDSMSGILSFTGGATVTGLPTPVNATDAANKSYVDNAVAGMTWKAAANLLSGTDFPLTGTWASITAGIDGHPLDITDVGYRLLLTGQTTDTENGIWTLTNIDGTNYLLVRASDADTYQELIGASIFVQEGTVYANTGWTQSNHYLTSFAAQNWVQFSGAGAYSGGVGITVSGTIISANLGAGVTNLPSGEIGLDIVSNLAVQLTSTATGGQLTLVLDTGSGLSQSATGLKIAAAGVTNAMLANPGFTLNADSGTDASGLQLGDTLMIKGTSTQGIVTSVTESPAGTSEFTITASNASSSQKGVASFDATQFTVTAGNVVLGTVPNSALANSVITFTGTSGSDAVALGESFAITGTGGITTAVTANAITVDLGTVAVNHGGTGLTTLAVNQLLIGNGTSPVAQSANLTFAADVLTVGGALPLTFDGALGAISATATNSDLVLMPNGTGSVVVGPVGAGLIQSDAATALTIRGNTTLTLESGTGDTTMLLTTGTGSKVTVSGPTAADYATGLTANDLTNKQYVDDAIQSGAASGSIKAVKVALSGAGTTNIGAAMPAGATVLSVKLQVTVAEATGTVSVGKTGSVAAYMTTAENDPSTTGLYLAETYVTEAASEQVIATVAVGGTYNVIVEYQVA